MTALVYVALLVAPVTGCGRIGFDVGLDATSDAALGDGAMDGAGMDASEGGLDAAPDVSLADGATDSAPDGAIDVRTGLLFELAFDDSTTSDTSGGGHDARCAGMGCPTLDPMGVSGQAASFDGSGQYLVVDDDGTFELAGGFTVSTWVNLSAAVARTCFFTKPLGGASENSFALCADAQVPFMYVCGAGGCSLQSASVSMPLDTWFHLAITNDGMTQRFYVDGAEAALSTIALAFDSSDAMVVGGDSDGGLAFAMTGLLDEIRVYDRALSMDEIGVLATRP